MPSPAAVRAAIRRNHGSGHVYEIDGNKVPGVTTLIRDGLPKAALIKWAASTAASAAVDEWDRLAELPVSERIDYLTKAPDRARDSAGVRGTRVHRLAEPLSHGEQVHVPDDLRGHVESCVKFLDDWRVTPLVTEAACFSRRWKYGGSPDLIADVDAPADLGPEWQGRAGAEPGRMRVLFDYKTSRKQPYGDVAFQLAAYRYAEFYLGEDGSEVPMIPVDESWVVWVRADSYDIYPFETTEHVYKQFLYIAQVAKAVEESRWYRMDALPRPQGRKPE